MLSSNYMIGRQPILNRNGEIVAYELLYRSAGSINSALIERMEFGEATRQLEQLGLSQSAMLSAQVKANSWRDGM
jgi:c-di-GMP-related signal transduction protein